MNTRILPALKACLTDGLADLHLLGQSAEGAEQDLAILMSCITRVLGSCRETPLERRFQLVPDHRGRLLAWEKAETNPKPFLQAAMLSHWTMKGWE